MRYVRWVLSLAALLGLVASSAFAQSPGTGANGSGPAVAQGTLSGLDSLARGGTPPDGVTLSLDPSLTLVRAVFEGETRPTPSSTTAILAAWFVFHQLDSSNVTFPEEWLFREGASRFWVPMEAAVAAALRPQLAGGEEIALTVAYFGASQLDGAILPFLPALLAEVESAGSEEAEEDAQWESFKPGAIRDIVEEERAYNARMDQGNAVPDGPVFSLSAWTRPTRATLIFMGKTRPISPQIAELLRSWLGTFGDDVARFTFDEEWLFREGQTNYWLPVQHDTARSMRPVVKKGDAVTVFFRYAGSYKEGGRESWVFPVMQTYSHE
jgi:hypothetical protein